MREDDSFGEASMHGEVDLPTKEKPRYRAHGVNGERARKWECSPSVSPCCEYPTDEERDVEENRLRPIVPVVRAEVLWQLCRGGKGDAGFEKSGGRREHKQGAQDPE